MGLPQIIPKRKGKITEGSGLDSRHVIAGEANLWLPSLGNMVPDVTCPLDLFFPGADGHAPCLCHLGRHGCVLRPQPQAAGSFQHSSDVSKSFNFCSYCVRHHIRPEKVCFDLFDFHLIKLFASNFTQEGNTYVSQLHLERSSHLPACGLERAFGPVARKLDPFPV